MSRPACGADLGLPDPWDMARARARREAQEYLRCELWGHSLPVLSVAAAQQVQLLRQEAVERQAARRAEGEAAVERQNERERTAQAERERRLQAEQLGEGEPW